jgi:hypothetical protein
MKVIGTRLRRRMSFVAAAILLCAATTRAEDTVAPTPEAARPASGRVWFYRTAPRSTPGVWQDIYLDGYARAKARPDMVYRGDVPAGHHVVKIMGNSLQFDLPEGGAVFIRADVDGALFGKGIYPVLVDADTARRELQAKGVEAEQPGSGTAPEALSPPAAE